MSFVESMLRTAGTTRVECVLTTDYSRKSPVTGLEWPRGFQEIKVLRFHDNGTGRW